MNTVVREQSDDTRDDDLTSRSSCDPLQGYYHQGNYRKNISSYRVTQASGGSVRLLIAVSSIYSVMGNLRAQRLRC